LYFILIPFAFIVAFTRVNLGAHYPSDVIFGYIIGFFISLITICIFPFYLPIFWEISDKLRYFWNLTFP
ncbi:MAG: phosphatase PAP2 family protein, partial [Candidatus Helarchaeota archaeon]